MTEHRHTPDSLADRLDQVLPPENRPASHDEDPLVDVALRMANAPRPQLSAEARSRIQQQVMQHAARQQVMRRPEFSIQPVLRWALVASVVLVVLFLPAARVTMASVPGDILYPAKQLVEQVERGLASTDEARAATHLTHAERRIQEAQVLLIRGQLDAPLLRAAQQNMADAAALVRNSPTFDPGLQLRLEIQTASLSAALDSLLLAATQPDQPLAATSQPVATELAATRDSGLLLPATATASATPTSPLTPTTTDAAAATSSATPALLPSTTETPAPSATAQPTGTAMPSPTEAPTLTWTPPASFTHIASPLPPTPTPAPQDEALPVNLIVEGPIEAINGNIIIIYGIEITFAPDDPVLAVLRVGDKIRVNGSITEAAGSTVVVISVETQPADDSIAISEDGQSVWRDEGDCANPPPPWAPAHGWRARCESSGGFNQPPGQSSNRSGRSNNSGRGRGRGSNNDDDD